MTSVASSSVNSDLVVWLPLFLFCYFVFPLKTPLTPLFGQFHGYAMSPGYETIILEVGSHGLYNQMLLNFTGLFNVQLRNPVNSHPFANAV
jgi:hypothetical protein